MNFFILKNEKKLGPFTQTNIEEMLSSAMLTPEDFVWYDGLKEWVQLNSILTDKEESQPATPPPSLSSQGAGAESQDMSQDREAYARILRGVTAAHWAKMPPMISIVPSSTAESSPQRGSPETREQHTARMKRWGQENEAARKDGKLLPARNRPVTRSMTPSTGAEPSPPQGSPETLEQYEARMARWRERDAQALEEGRLLPIRSLPPNRFMTASSAEETQPGAPSSDTAGGISDKPAIDSTNTESSVVPAARGATIHAAKKALSIVGTLALWIAISLGLVFLVGVFVKGAAWASLKILPTLTGFAAVTGGILIGPGFLFVVSRKTRPWLGMAMWLWSYLAGLALWMSSLLVVWQLWGLGAVIIGLFLAGIGVVPIAFLACLFKAEWGDLLSLAISLVCVMASRGFGTYLSVKSEESVLCPSCGLELNRAMRNCPNCGGIVASEKPPKGLIAATWILMACCFFIPIAGWLCFFPGLATSIMLIRSRNKTGKINGIIAVVVMLSVFVLLGLYGFFHADSFLQR